MADTKRLALQATLLTMAPKAWYQKPPDVKMSYPCFIYKAIEPNVIRADNKAYLLHPGYEVLYINSKESDEIWAKMLSTFAHCSPGRKYVTSNLYHYPFTIYL